MNKKLISMFLLGVVVTACSDSTSSGNAGRLAPLVDATGNQTFDAAPNEYIVVLKKGADAQAEASVARAAGGYVMNVWKASLNGYAIRANAGTLAAIRRSLSAGSSTKPVPRAPAASRLSIDCSKRRS